MWKWVTETKTIEGVTGQKFSINQLSLVDDDGRCIEFHGTSREQIEKLLYKDCEVLLELYATRYSDEGRQPLDHYEISLALHTLHQKEQAKKLLSFSKSKLDRIKSSIVDALQIMHRNSAESTPINQYLFIDF